MHDSDEVEIIHGRHPVIEAFIDEPFIPNNTYLNNSTDRLLIITAQTWAEKALSCDRRRSSASWPRWGSFVPAESACLPLLDRV
jgi:DNA mismatch repair protein MutS